MMSDEPSVTKVLSLSSGVNGEYAEKAITYKWAPRLKLLMIEKSRKGAGFILKM
jgi:hypothetical protein